SLQKCFIEVGQLGVPSAYSEKVSYERFRAWLFLNKEAFTLSRWLLSGGVCVTLTDDSDTPTFYQTLAGVTHLEESDIIDLEKRYWLLKAQSRTGRFDLETFVPLVSPPIHASLSEVCFKVFDVDHDGVLSRDELHEMVVALLEVWKDNRTDTLPLRHLTLEDYQIWSVSSALANEFLNLLFQVGLEPLRRRDKSSGQNWFLISMLWWQQWKDYVKYEHKGIVLEQPSLLSSLRNSVNASTVEPLLPDRLGGLGTFSFVSPSEERSPDGVSSSSEATETGWHAHFSPDCFARQHNTSDNNNQCFSGANGHIPSQLAAQRPGAIDNQSLVNTDPMKAPTLTLEGGRLKRSLQLVPGRDFETVPEPVWRALYHWYGANLSLPRPVILDSKTSQAELELFPRYLLFLRQQPATRSPQSNVWVNMGSVPSPNAPLKRVLAYTGCFSRIDTIKDIHLYLSQRLRIKEEDMRLWLYNSENYLTLLDDEDHTLENLKIQDEQQLVIEVRNKDMSWPEEMSFIANSSKMDRHKVPTEKGATGLSNLGNTCFMNSSIQCVSNTKALTDYFLSGRHLYELNRSHGQVLRGFGDGALTPVVHEKPYVELKDSNGRPDWEVASEAWENHLRRNRSIVVDLFHGQLKSQVKCKTCGHISARFDPFNFLSLPLPMDSYMHLEITVIKLEGSTPVRYGLRLNMDEKYMGLKKQLSELCSLKPEQILLAEVHTSNIKNFPLDNQKVRLSANGFLCAFEVPVPGSPMSLSSPTLTDLTPTANGSVSGDGLADRSALIPNGGPNIVVPCSPEMPLGNGLANGRVTPLQESPFIGYIIAMHRKMMRTELYFLSSQKNRPSLFGMPLIVPCTVHTTKKDLYDAVWIQVSRLASPLPPQEASNHAQDCDDSMGYQYPFTLRVVGKDGNTCAWCPWYRFCRGCIIECTDDRASLGNAYIAVDWDPTALHLRYQTSQERIVEEHCSVEQSRRAQAEPISLDSCLKAFTSEEELGEDELYYCSKCKTHRLATKKLDLWRLPPILIVHLKRFQFVNGRWIKSQKIVKFPRENFDPSAFLAPRDLGQHCLQSRSESEDLLRVGEDNLSSISAPAGFYNLPKGSVLNFVVSPTASPASSRKSAPSLSRTSSPSSSPKSGGGGRRPARLRLAKLGGKHWLSNSKENLDGAANPEADLHAEGGAALAPEETTESSLSTEASSSHCDVVLVNGDSNGLSLDCSTDSSLDPDNSLLQHRDNMCLDAVYNLYAISCHSGIMGGGHYVTYAKNPKKKWYCYNDSSCKEVHSEEIDTDSAYILFYEQQGVEYSQFLPKIDGKKMADTSSMDEDFESDYKKYCVLQ
uniref:ubiquitinyl hydrolase 1 n=1 Tax=Takifugu rubripes TaxID=31033 RepID=A0A674P3W2_TAKRU